MQEMWVPIPKFDGYLLSNYGQVINEQTGKPMAILCNQYGVAHVVLQESCPVSQIHIVASRSSILDRPEHEAFDTPINLDGDRLNNRADNLMWRPRWFAVQYNHQFTQDHISIETPIQDVKTGETFKNSWDAATKLGLLDKERSSTPYKPEPMCGPLINALESSDRY